MTRLGKLLFLLLSVLSRDAVGQVYDAAIQFNPTNNSINNVWRYGTRSGIAGNLITAYTAHDAQSGIQFWRNGSFPSVSHNGTNLPVTIAGTTWQVGQLALLPGMFMSYSVVRWTAPTSGVYRVEASFTGIATSHSTTDVHVVHNLTRLLDGGVNSTGAGPFFTNTLTVATGDRIDFVVGPGADFDNAKDTTALSVRITRGPDVASCRWLGFLPGNFTTSVAQAISADGAVIVGACQQGGFPPWAQGYRWTEVEGMVGLGNLPGESECDALGVSADGAVVAGPGGYAYRWTASQGMVGLGTLPGYVRSFGWGISADGSVVVGAANSLENAQAFRWTESDGMVGLGDLSGSNSVSEAHAASSDGAVVVGMSNSSNGAEAFHWTAADGMVGLGDLAGGVFRSAANSVSADGAVAVGYGATATGQEAFRWTAETGMISLGDLPGGAVTSVAYCVTADGAVVVGSGTSSNGTEAFVWDATGGMRHLGRLLQEEFGVNVATGALTIASGVSSNGLVIVGRGWNPPGLLQAWRVELPRFWEGLTDGAWVTRSNWFGGQLPSASEAVVIRPANGLLVTGPTGPVAMRSLLLDTKDTGLLEVWLQFGSDLVVTNHFDTGVIDIRKAQLILSSGTAVRADVLRVTQTGGWLVFNGGTLATERTTVTNGTAFTVGDGISAATFILLGGVHSFADGLRVRNAAVVTGCGTITGPVTIEAGGTLLADCGGRLTFTGIVTNNGTLRAINGSVLASSGTLVNNSVIDLISGGVTNFSGAFVNNGTILTADSVMVGGAAVAGQDFLLHLMALAGHTYTLQFTASLSATNWNDVGASQAGSNSMLTFSDPGGATNSPARFYRIKVVAP
ncbi:MAG: hypothetical protein PCFJNLEI_01493 [Verrucomicrobiae bacterium]|nr:hypothetical protein [Verrucomicrobiae bacterium]